LSKGFPEEPSSVAQKESILSFITMREILADCREEGWAVPAFDVVNHETVLAALEGAEAEKAPVILMVLPGHTPQKHWSGLAALVRAEAERATIPVCLQLDHATRLDQVQAALALGFSSVMIDGSTLPLEENIALTRKVVDKAHARGVSVEAELGHVAGGEEVLDRPEPNHVGTGSGEAAGLAPAASLTRVEEAGRFVAETGVDALAVAIGTVHGLYSAEPRLDFERLAALRKATSIPLVLHGGSGTPDAHIRRAVAGGICKVNIWTEVALVFSATLTASLAIPTEHLRLHQALAVARASAQEIVQQKIRLLGAAGKAG
jgi:ketose-bisphosphate aldolase